MNITQRNQQFLAALDSLRPTKAQVRAVAEAIGCPCWVGHCDAVDHPRMPHECWCETGATNALKLAGEK